MNNPVDQHLIYLDRLREGGEHKLCFDAGPDLVGVCDEDLRFEDPIHIEGVAYVVGGELIVRLDARTKISLPCTICNNWVETEVVVNNFYDVTPVEEVKGHIYDIRGTLREELLLSVPHQIECAGNCPKRKEYEKYLKKPDNGTYYPFKDL